MAKRISEKERKKNQEKPKLDPRVFSDFELVICKETEIDKQSHL